MSRVYFHTPSGQAELHGSERAHLSHVARSFARAAWAIDGYRDLAWMADILSMIPEHPDGPYGANYLHNYLRKAQTERARADTTSAAGRKAGRSGCGDYDPEPMRRLTDALQLRLNSSASETVLHVAGVDLHAYNVGLNTALAVGSDIVRIAAKIDGWCESHGWFDGPDRGWLADIIDQGLQLGVYRRELRGIPQGWENVQTLLRSRDDEPVVMSYSVCSRFPNPEIADWQPAADEQWQPDWATDGHTGTAEWAETNDDDRTTLRHDHACEQWWDLPDEQQWTLAMAGLQKNRPWAQISPTTLATTTFGPNVTVYDLLAPDRDARITAITGLQEAPSASRP